MAARVYAWVPAGVPCKQRCVVCWGCLHLLCQPRLEVEPHVLILPEVHAGAAQALAGGWLARCEQVKDQRAVIRRHGRGLDGYREDGSV